MKNIYIAFAFVLFTACSSDDAPQDFTADNEAEIQTYITENNLTAQKSNSGLYYVIDSPGERFQPTETDRVTVAYKGYYTNGVVFDETNNDGASFNLQSVIRGWTEGITYFKQGGSGKLLIPSRLGYGSNDVNGIPAGSVLIFDINLISVNYAKENEEEIEAYIVDKGLSTQKSESGLYYTIDEVGIGKQPTLSDNVTLSYTGYFTNGDVFDSQTDGIDFDLQNVINGFSEGVTYLKEGGSGSFIIPAHLAYGDMANGSITRGSVIIFDIKLISVN
ncbi:FKBP-type peptidyl-prolyl cis-trans isomerase [uncultured Algibacter sp.]|uniref:FKBP-type peptidyl-prolyl cis-trans isomerase n=1 Tax=uncultured Algibacter sp. TaxID=298659 RepID=UPI003217EEED